MRSVLKLPLWGWFVLSLLVYSSVLISPKLLAISALVSVAVPIVIVVNIILFLISMGYKSKTAFHFIILLVLGIPFINVGVSFSGTDDLDAEGLKVLNYNVKWFFGARGDEKVDEFMNWIEKADADILCFQEFDARRRIADRIKSSGPYYEAIFDDRYNLVVYSKYPIIDKGLLLESVEWNNILFADLRTSDGIIRIYSAHLQSMGINPDKIQNTDGIKAEYESVKSKFLKASSDRTEQIEMLLEHASNSPYPVLLTGDFNDVPFSYNYFKIRRRFSNTFEAKGKGFGATYNGKIPYLRIDNQFYSEQFEPVAFKTFNDVYFSDHFPIIGIYQITR